LTGSIPPTWPRGLPDRAVFLFGLSVAEICPRCGHNCGGKKVFVVEGASVATDRWIVRWITEASQIQRQNLMVFSPQTFPAPASMPERKPARLDAQPIIPWTAALLLTAGWQWLIAETWEQDTLPRFES
jgi:hypothetical protein